MDGRNTHPYQGGSNGIGGGVQSSASFASSSKLRPPTYLAQAPTFSPANKPRQSSGSLRRSLIGESSVDSLQRETSSSSIFPTNGTAQRRRGRKSAFDTFDELSFCNDLASKIANELAARPSRNPRRSVPIDPWRGKIPGNGSASTSAQEGAHIPTTETLDSHQNGIEGQEEEEVDDDDGESDEEEDDDSDSEEEDSDEDDDDDDDDEEDIKNDTAGLNPERTERTRLAAVAFLQRLSEREANGDVDESEKGLEKQVFEVFGGSGNQSEGPEIRASADQLEQEDVSPEVAMQVAQMLQKSATQTQPGQKPLIQEVEQLDSLHDVEPSEILGDSSVEYDQLNSTSSGAARLGGEQSRNHDDLLEDEIGEEDDNSNSGEAEIELEGEDEENIEEDEGEGEDEDEEDDDESEGVGEDYYDEEQHHQNLYSQPSRGDSMGMTGSNQEEAISLIDSDEEDEMPANSQPADYNRMAYDAAQYERYQDGSDDEQEDYEEQEEDVEDEDDEMDEDEDEDEGVGEMHAQNGLELLSEGIVHAPVHEGALFQNQQMPAFDANLAAPMPSDPSHLWQNSIQSLQALNDLAQAPPALFEQSVSSDQASFPSAIPQAAFSPNLFDQAFPASSSNIDNQAIPQISPQNPTWSSFPVPPSPAPVPPPPAEAEAIGTADGEALLQLKEQVNEQLEEDQQRSHRTSMSPVPPSTVMTPQANQSTASTPKPKAGNVQDGSDLVDLKNVVKRAAAIRSQRTSAASDIGTPQNEFPPMNAVQPIVEEEEELAQEPATENAEQDQNLGQEIEITEVRSTTGDQAVEHWHFQPDVESVASLIHEHVTESQDNGEEVKELHIQEMLVDGGDTEEAAAGKAKAEESESSLPASGAQVAEVDGRELPVFIAEDKAEDQGAEVEETKLPVDTTEAQATEVEESVLSADAPELQAAVTRSKESHHEGLQDAVVENPLDTVKEALAAADAPPAEPVQSVDSNPEEDKEDLQVADEDEALEELMEIDQSIPDLEVNVEAPTADENAERKGLAENLAEERHEHETVPASVDQKVGEEDTQNLKVPEEVSIQEAAETSSADQNEEEKAAETSVPAEPRRSGRKRASITETPVETSTADGDASNVLETEVPAAETRRETRSSTKRAASEALSAKSGNEGDHTHQQRSSPQSHRKPRRSDPDGDMADYVPDDVRRKRMRSRTRSPSVARETAIPSSIGIPDKLLDTSILEVDEEEEEDEDGQQVSSPTPARKRKTSGRKRRSSKNTEMVEQHIQESLPEQNSNTDEPESQSSQPDKKANPREKTKEEKLIYKRNHKKTYDKKRRRSTKDTTETASSSAGGEKVKGGEVPNIDLQNSKDDPEFKAEADASAPTEPIEEKATAPSPPKRVTRRRTRQLTEEQEADSSQSLGADQSMTEVDADEKQKVVKQPRRGRSRGRM